MRIAGFHDGMLLKPAVHGKDGCLLFRVLGLVLVLVLHSLMDLLDLLPGTWNLYYRG
jgi:hypothetical protein